MFLPRNGMALVGAARSLGTCAEVCSCRLRSARVLRAQPKSGACTAAETAKTEIHVDLQNVVDGRSVDRKASRSDPLRSQCLVGSAGPTTNEQHNAAEKTGNTEIDLKADEWTTHSMRRSRAGACSARCVCLRRGCAWGRRPAQIAQIARIAKVSMEWASERGREASCANRANRANYPARPHGRRQVAAPIEQPGLSHAIFFPSSR